MCRSLAPCFQYLENFCTFNHVLAKISSSLDLNFSQFSFPRPPFLKKNPLPRPYILKPAWHTPTKKKKVECPPPGTWWAWSWDLSFIPWKLFLIITSSFWCAICKFSSLTSAVDFILHRAYSFLLPYKCNNELIGVATGGGGQGGRVPPLSDSVKSGRKICQKLGKRPGGVLSTKVYPGTCRWIEWVSKSASWYNDDPLFSAKTGIDMGHIFKIF